jgi:DNA repair protein RadD
VNALVQTDSAPVDWLDVLPPQADCLRPYQREQLARLAQAMHAGYRRILVQLPTGGGKTHEIAALVAAAVLAGLRVLILATRTRLVRQLHERLVAFDVRHGVVAAPLP